MVGFERNPKGKKKSMSDQVNLLHPISPCVSNILTEKLQFVRP